MTVIRYYLHSGPDLAIATEGSSGVDLRLDLKIGCRNWDCYSLPPGEREKFQTGLRLEMPLGVEAQVRSRSGLATKYGVFCLLSPGTIDSDYRGDVDVLLYNSGREAHVFQHGDRIAQLVFQRVLVPTTTPETKSVTFGREPDYFVLKRVADPSELSATTRGEGGFGSTGR